LKPKQTQPVELILAFDIGTSSLRTSLFTTAAERIISTTCQEAYPLQITADGGAEFPPAVLRGAALRCLRHTMESFRKDAALSGARVVGVGTTCFWHSLVGIGEGNTAITPVITWADSRCKSDAAQLREEFDEHDIHARTGCMLRASFWPAKLVWLARTKGSLFSKVRLWVSPGEWLQREFCGENVKCAYGMATGTGLFNPSKLDWVGGLLERCQITKGQLAEMGDEPAQLLPEWKAEFPELAGIPWFPAIGDGAASNLGCGATQPGLAAINVGTSAALRVMSEGQVARAPFGLFCYRVDANRFLIGGAVSNAGNLRAWCLRELKLEEDPIKIEAELLSRSEPAHGLTVLPFWTAERAPTWRDDLTGAIVGLTQNTTALDILQATTEAVYYRIARIAEMVEEHENRKPRFVVSGGIQHSQAAIQRLCDVLDAPLYASSEQEASVRGAAVFAAEKLGYAIEPFKEGTAVEPRRRPAAMYREERRRQANLEALLAG
jgi:gluconokinase